MKLCCAKIAVEIENKTVEEKRQHAAKQLEEGWKMMKIEKFMEKPFMAREKLFSKMATSTLA